MDFVDAKPVKDVMDFVDAKPVKVVMDFVDAMPVKVCNGLWSCHALDFGDAMHWTLETIGRGSLKYLVGAIVEMIDRKSRASHCSSCGDDRS